METRYQLHIKITYFNDFLGHNFESNPDVFQLMGPDSCPHHRKQLPVRVPVRKLPSRSEEVGRPLSLCVSANILERGDHAGCA